jgi:ABC-type transporter Mla maintaining outer membrane lipid asymmetry ATPase subunit MlaF
MPPSPEYSTAAPALEMRDVTVTSLRDSSLIVLEGVNWTVAPGEFWAVAGLTRSGKSDFMAMAAGIMRPARGIYRVFGHELIVGFEQERVAARLHVGLVFDGGQLIHDLTLAENVALPLRYHHGDTPDDLEPRLTALFEMTGLEPWADSYPASVNRNWQQRIGLARALALKPAVLLLDSPLTGLDPHDAAWWLETLGTLAKGHPLMDGKPLTVVVTGDDLRPWRNRAAQFGILKSRQFVALGTNEDVASREQFLLQDMLPVPASKS